MPETLATRLVKMRKQKRINLTELADQVGIAYTDLQAIEKGKKQPTDDQINAFAKVLGIDPNYLHSGNIFFDHTDDLIADFKKLAMEEQHDFIALFSTLRKPQKTED
jgi:transcriptional regulator with XRE-family HTH domain